VVAVGTALETATPTETAKGQQLFLDEVRTLNGVLHVENYGGRTIGERSIRVHVRRGDLETEYAVYDLKGAVYQRYPDACLNVEVWLEDCPETAAAADPDTAPDAGTA
jgi:hypothetical protein